MTHATGIKLAKGEFVENAGIDCMTPLRIKNTLIAFVSWFINARGKKLMIEYLVVQILLVPNALAFAA